MRNCCQNAVAQTVAQRGNRLHLRQIGIGILDRSGKTDDVRHILGAAALAALLPTAVDQVLDPHTLLHIQKPDALGRMNLMSGE